MRDIEMHETKGITFLAVAESCGNTYFSAWNHNGLFQLHEDGTADFITLFHKCGGESPRHEFAIGIRDMILFIPSRPEQEIAIFIPKTEEVEYVNYPAPEKKCLCRPFWGYINENDILYLLPNNYDAILAYNLDSRTFFRYVLPIKTEAFGDEKSVFIGGETVGKTVYFCPWNCEDLVSFDLQTFEFKMLGKVNKNTYRHIFVIDQKIFLFPRILEDGFVVYDLRENSLAERDTSLMMEGVCVCTFITECGEIFFLPNEKNKAWIWNTVSGALSSIEIKVKSEEKVDALNFYEARDLWGGKIISTDWDNLSQLFVDGEEINVFDVKRDEDLFLKILMNMQGNHTGMLIYEY